MAQTQVWQVAHQTGGKKPLGGTMCGSNWTITLKGKDKTEIDFMCLTMIDPATSWLELIEFCLLYTSDAADD